MFVVPENPESQTRHLPHEMCRIKWACIHHFLIVSLNDLNRLVCFWELDSYCLNLYSIFKPSFFLRFPINHRN